LFRSVIQDRGDNVSFIISGSRVHLLETILGSGVSPLFVHFERQDIGELDKKNSMLLFNKYLKAKGLKRNDKIAQEAYSIVGGHPLYLMALAESWDGKQDITKVFDSLLTNTLGTLKLYCDYLLSEDLSTVIKGPMPRTILRALSEQDEGLSYSEISKKIAYSMNKLPKYVKPLIDADLVVQDKGKFLIRDKILREYLKIEAKELF